ncbi:hypothetical protein NKG94_00840 [Micromonospora sp. M12]
MSLQILGPLRIWRDDVELDAGPANRHTSSRCSWPASAGRSARAS